MPDGYKTFSTAGISFAYPAGWQVSERKDAEGAPAVEITPPDKSKTPFGLIQLSVSPKAGSRFQSLADQRRIVVKQVNDAKIDSDGPVDIPGARKALRAKATTPAGRGADHVEVKADSLDVLRDNDDVVTLTVGRHSARARSSIPAPSLTPSGSAADAGVRRQGSPLAGARGCRGARRGRADRGVRTAVAAVPPRCAGAGSGSPAIVLLGAALAAGGIVVLVARLARLTRPVSAARLGLRAPDDLARALLLAVGAVLALAARRRRLARARRPARRLHHPAGARHPHGDRPGLRPARPRPGRVRPRAAGVRARALRSPGRRRRDPRARLRLPALRNGAGRPCPR